MAVAYLIQLWLLEYLTFSDVIFLLWAALSKRTIKLANARLILTLQFNFTHETRVDLYREHFYFCSANFIKSID